MIRQSRNTSRQQTISSLVILTILVVVAAAVILAQFRFNPAVLSKDANLLGSPPDNASAPPAATPYFDPPPQGLTPFSASEIFDAQSLSDKIDGKAELYLSAGFERLVSQRFRDAASDSGLWFEAFVYDMANGRNAFSVFSSQRREDAVALDLTAHAYRAPNAIFFVHGRYYVEIIASEASQKVLQPMKLLAETFIRTQPEETTAIDEMQLFPQQGLVADSIALISSDAFGYAGLDRVYTAEYELDETRLMAFISRRETKNDAQKLADAYREFLMTFGGRAIETSLPIAGAYLVEILDTYEIIYSNGAYVAGVREAASIDQAQKLAVRLYHRIREVNGDS